MHMIPNAKGNITKSTQLGTKKLNKLVAIPLEDGKIGIIDFSRT